MRIYHNGGLVDTRTAAISASAWTRPFALSENSDAAIDGSIADPMMFERVLSPAEVRAIADPGNTDLRVGGIPLILPKARRLWGVGAVATGWKPAWAVRRQRTIGTGAI
jgi:hypothetical protein